ncbi:MAG: nuclease-related domain-containing protein [Neobacillus sp.]
MIIRARPEPLVLILLKFLNARMVIPIDHVKKLKTLQKGYEGEQRSDTWLKDNLTDNWLVIHDLLLEYQGSKFQIDTLIIAFERVFLLDIKNFEGDYFEEDDKWRTETYPTIHNPLHQLNRCETLFLKLLHELGYQHPVEPHLIFNNPEFHLYTSSKHATIVFPTQLNRFMKKLNARPVKLNNRDFQLAEQLVSRHIVESPYPNLPSYTYDQLKKGIICPDCYSFFTYFNKATLCCKKCGCKEGLDDAVIRSVKELKLLFPEKVITTEIVFEWCSIIKSRKIIRRVLSRHFKKIGTTCASHYEVY